MIENYSQVQLLTDKYLPESASKGDLGSVIEVYRNSDYEVEFADGNGIDFAQIVAREEELRVVTEEPFASDASQRKRLTSFK